LVTVRLCYLEAAESAEIPPGLEPFDGLVHLISVKAKWDGELYRSARILLSLYETLGHRRRAAIAKRRMLSFGWDDSAAFRETSAAEFAIDRVGYLLGPGILDEISSLPFEKQLRTCSALLWDSRSGELQTKAADRLNELLTRPEFNDTFSFPLPVFFEFRPMGPVIQKVPVTLQIRFFCRFQGTIVCPQLRIVLWSKDPKGHTNFIAEDFHLCNEAMLELSGVFEYASVYIPNMITIRSKSSAQSVLRTMIPPNFLAVRVSPPPPPLDFSIDVPRFLLPNHWQVALVRLDVARVIPQLGLKVSGLSYKAAALRSKNSIASDVLNRLSFSNVAPGEYEISIPIKPRLSGTLRVEAQTEGQSVLREVPFTVSDFLEMRLICRVISRVVQLSARVTSAVTMEISEVTFTGGDNELIGNRSIGVPMTIGQTQVSALFILEAVPESGHIFVQQPGLRPFELVLRVAQLREGALMDPELQPIAALSTVMPVGFNW
jgi:hypothetical protein